MAEGINIEKAGIFSLQLLQTLSRVHNGQKDEYSVGPLTNAGVGTYDKLSALCSAARQAERPRGATLGDTLLSFLSSNPWGKEGHQQGQ